MAGTASGGSRRSRLAPYLLVAPGILWLLVFFVVPTITLAQTSVSGAGPWYEAYGRALGNYGVHFFRSLRYALGATLLALAMGYPLAPDLPTITADKTAVASRTHPTKSGPQ